MYEIINEALGIKACKLEDLTIDQVNHLLNQWKDGIRIGSLTMFFDQNTGELILNKSNKEYNTYLALAEAYMAADSKSRSAVREKNDLPELLEAFNVMERCLKSRIIKKRIFHAKENVVVGQMPYELVNELIKKYEPRLAAILAYQCGVAYGKRVERKRFSCRTVGTTVLRK